MITMPTTELIGCLSDVLPQISDEKGALAGVKVAWDGESLHFTTYDVHSGATIEWTPGQGAEGDMQHGPEGSEWDDDINWGGDDDPWETWVWLPHAKDIVKLFKLPAKLWRFPVTLKCTAVGDLIVERVDSPRGNRELRLPGDRDMLRKIPDVRAEVDKVVRLLASRQAEAKFNHQRLGAFGSVRLHGTMVMTFGADDAPTAVRIGSRFAGFLYPVGAKNVRPYSFLRDASGFHASQASSGEAEPDEEF
jgi:hypothetical protein